MKKYDVEKEQKHIDALLKYSWVEGVAFYLFFGLAYLGYDLKLEKFTGFFALSGFLLLVWFVCECFIIGIHYIIKHKREKEKVGEQHENK